MGNPAKLLLEVLVPVKYILTNYEADCSWISRYTSDYLIYDRSDCGLPNRIPRANFGDADYDRLSYIVDYYHELPDVFLLAKSNLLEKFITKEEFDAVKDNTVFTPLLTQNHKTYEPVCRYVDGIYEEINSSWYVPAFEHKYFDNYADFAKAFFLPNPDYLRFAPGGNYIVRRDDVHKYSQEFYDDLRSILPYSQRPAEAHMIERTYYTLWS